MINKEKFLQEIKSNINKHGHHINIVTDGLCPRFGYTIGAIEKIGLEVVFAGGLYYTNEEVSIIIDGIISELNKNSNWQELNVEIDSIGSFSLSKVHDSWCKLLMLGVYDFYKTDNITALQILPDESHYTVEIPKLINEFNSINEPIWQWLVNNWSYPTPKNCTIITNLDALFGKLITEIMRWEEDEWEMFSGPGPDVEQEDIRIVPIGVILGIDNSTVKALDLKIGKGLWRHEENKEWNDWG